MEKLSLATTTTQLAQLRSKSVSRTALPVVAGVVYLILAVFWMLFGLLQVALPLISSDVVGVGGTDLRLTGAWNVFVSVVYVVIGIFLTRRSKRAYSWGLWSALTSIPFVLFTGGLNCVFVPVLFAYAVAALLLWKSRLEFDQSGPEPTTVSKPTSLPMAQKDHPSSASRKAVLILGALSLAACAMVGSCLVFFGIAEQYSLEHAHVTSFKSTDILDPASIPPLDPVSHEEISAKYLTLTEPEKKDYLASLIGKHVHWKGTVIDVHRDEEMILLAIASPNTVRIEAVPKQVVTSVRNRQIFEFEGIIADIGESSGLRITARFLSQVQEIGGNQE